MVSETLDRPAVRKIPAWRGWPPLLLLPLAALLLTPADWPPWALTWLLTFAIFLGVKWLTWRRTPAPAAPWWRHVAYLAAWPGLDAAAFLHSAPAPAGMRVSSDEWARAVRNLILGAALFWGLARLVPDGHPFVTGWVGLVGLALMLHFGSLQLLSYAWRAAGVDARPLMKRPTAAVSVSEFWGRRWNTAFRDLAHRFLFRPLTARLGPRWGLFAGFLFSGLVHDLVISVPAGGGYGLPTLFFLLQAGAIAVERSRIGRAVGLGRGWVGWLFTGLVLLAPACLLFHPLFLRRVVVPFMAVLGARGGLGLSTGGWGMREVLPTLILIAGAGQLSVLIASSLVPLRLKWQEAFAALPRLHRQMYWVYGGYVVLAIIAFGLLSLTNAEELAAGGPLARGVCLYIAAFWGIRVLLQGVLDAKPFLTTWWLALGYHGLTVLFGYFTAVYSLVALWPAG
jgi:alginate O-acetyltransferase complex protein AlgI